MAAFSSFLIGMTILFGISAQMLLLDIRIKNLKGAQRIFFGVGNLLVLLVNMALSLVLPVDQYMKFYVLVVHVPIFFIFWLTTKITAVKVIFALFTAVFLIYPANVVLTIVSQTAKWLYPVGFYISYTAVCAVILLVIYSFFKTNFNYLIKNYSGLSFIKLCLLPLAYYIANYWLGLYNFAAVISTGVFLLRILIFIITLIAYFLILDIAKSTREKEALQGEKMALSFLLGSAEHQLSALQATQEQAAVYRHDMRHHLALIGGYLADGDIEKAEKYVRLAQADIEEITPNRYCENNTVNLILSSFAGKAKASGVNIVVDANLPSSLDFPETELCALLSNGLENAIAAAAQVADEQFRKTRISCQTHKENLLILIENSCAGEVTMENGLPQSNREGHGFGVKSMTMIAEKHNGYCSFEAKDGIFTLKIVLPLKK
ncbi:MAG: GHKL domain-containing protein [Desulfitobacteriaceae bacterium]|nr:GHKL domain-containing protein [Desulfitobacteriaceae bacterium]